ncbi:hypothetical protein C8Q80DRAFT_519750 [Daedaleopsis nitida]|nr:hypothetical protein C8Q80DRAFT_519750 [Daedaleopsis nitida]
MKRFFYSTATRRVILHTVYLPLYYYSTTNGVKQVYTVGQRVNHRTITECTTQTPQRTCTTLVAAFGFYAYVQSMAAIKSLSEHRQDNVHVRELKATFYVAATKDEDSTRVVRLRMCRNSEHSLHHRLQRRFQMP